MYSRRSSVVFTYIICVRSTKAGTDPSSLPGLRVPTLPAGPRCRGGAPRASLLPILSAGPPAAGARGDLRAGVAANARFGPPVRADVPLTCDPACESAEGRAIFLGKGETLYVEVQGGLR